MPQPPRRPLLPDLVWPSFRFVYLLAGGMLLSSQALYGRLRLPGLLWRWPRLVQALLGPWGRGLALGLGLVMSLAAFMEIWEIVDHLLSRFFDEHER